MEDSLIKIGNKKIGSQGPVFVIAEAGVNHNGSTPMAKDLIRAAKRAGADCVKFQTFKAERVVTQLAEKAHYQTLVTDPSESQIDMLRKLELDESAYAELIQLCQDEDIIFTSTPYNEEDVDFLVDINVPILKAASIHIAEPAFIRYMAATGKPLIMSTGMATMDEVQRAIEAIRETGNENFVVLQCTTNYPSLIEDTNLRAMVSMRDEFNCLVGYSDHTQSHVPCIVSVALGACLIEKHFTLDKSLPGPDHSTSETPEEFAVLVNSIRAAEDALGSKNKAPTKAESINMPNMRRSISARKNIAAGSILRDQDLICRRPASGISPGDWSKVLGRKVKRDIAEGELFSWNDLDV